MLRPFLPGLRAVYRLSWGQIADMSHDELIEHIDQFEHWVSVISSGAYEAKGK